MLPILFVIPKKLLKLSEVHSLRYERRLLLLFNLFSQNFLVTKISNNNNHQK